MKFLIEQLDKDGERLDHKEFEVQGDDTICQETTFQEGMKWIADKVMNREVDPGHTIKVHDWEGEL